MAELGVPSGGEAARAGSASESAAWQRRRHHASGISAVAARRSLVLVLAAASQYSSGATTIWEVGKPQGHIDIADMPTPHEFYRKFMMDEDGPFGKAGRPALFKGAAKAMPAYQLWTDDYLRKTHGKVKMDQIETEKKETRSKLPHEGWSMAKFLDKYNESVLYSTATTPKGMSDEVYFLPLMNCGGFTRRLSSTVTWFSSGETKSVIHKDGQHNIHCIFDGRKDWILWHPESPIASREFGWINGEQEAEKNPQFKDTYGVYAGMIDPDDVDLKKFPKWDTLKWWSLTMEPGDCAYIPPAWYHFVQAPPQRTLSVHIWFFTGSKFDHKSCDALEEKGYKLTDYLVRIGDCTWGFEADKPKKTNCRIKKPLSPGLARPTSDEL